MPIFEYRCSSCGQRQDHLHRHRGEAAPLCKHCQSDSLERLVSLSSFQLKGKGWYVSDYKPAATQASATSKAAAPGESVAAVGGSDGSPEVAPAPTASTSETSASGPSKSGSSQNAA